MRSYRDKPRISVVIPVRNEGRLLAATVSSIIEGRSWPFPLEIVVVDDASSDGCCHSLPPSSAAKGIEICVVRLPRWSGIPFARNAGARVAKSDLLFMTDANVRFPRHWDQFLWPHLSPNRVLCATIADQASSFRGYGGTLQILSMGFAWLRNAGIYGNCVPLTPCSATILPAELFRRSGGYDTAMPVYGAAEPEFSVRLWLSGAEIISLPHLVLEHRFRPPDERRPFLDAIRPVLVANFIRFGLLYLSGPQITQMLRYYQKLYPSIFSHCLGSAWNGDVWHRRTLLSYSLVHPFSSFVKRFDL